MMVHDMNTRKRKLQNKVNLGPSIIVPSSAEQTSHFFSRNERPVSVQVQSDISRSLAQWIATAGRGRPISVVEDIGLQQTLCIEMCLFFN